MNERSTARGAEGVASSGAIEKIHDLLANLHEVAP